MPLVRGIRNRATAAIVNTGIPGVMRRTRWSQVWWVQVPPEVELGQQAKREG